MLREREPETGARPHRREPRAVRPGRDGAHHAPVPLPQGTRRRGWNSDRPIETGEVDLAKTARAVVTELGAADLVVVDIPEGTVAADRSLIVEIVRQLLEYALQHAPERSTVTICADSEKSGLRLWVSEHSLEIDPADRASILDRFHPIDRSATRPHGGPGLGLHLATGTGAKLPSAPAA